MNQKKLIAAIRRFKVRQNENPDAVNEAIAERYARITYYQSFSEEKLLVMSEDDFYKYVSQLWAMVIWGNKKYVVDKIIADNGFDNIKKQLAELFFGSADIASFEDKEGITLLQQPSTAFYFVGMNTKVDKLSDVKVRQAIAKSINRQNMIDGALDGYGEPTTTFIAEGLPGYTEGFDPLPYDVDAAKELMAEAGYADGFDLTISVPEERSAQAQLVQADLAQIGINVTIDLIETGAFWDALENGDYEMMIMGWSYVVMDPDVGYYSLYKKDDISGNYTGFGNEETDGLLQQGRVSSDEAERAEIYAELEEIVMTDAPYVPLYWRVDAIAFNSDLEGVEIPPCGLYYVYDYSWK